MANFLDNNFLVFDIKTTDSDYWDWILARKLGIGVTDEGLVTDCLASYIDLSNASCYTPGTSDIVSLGEYAYSGAVSKGLKLNNIGLTGVDNGVVTFDRDTITEDEFMELYTHSSLELGEGDLRLHLRPVAGNNQIYDYTATPETDGEGNPLHVCLNGGFYQGFFSVGDGCDYTVLPRTLANGWSMEFVIRPMEGGEEHEKPRLNDVNPSNGGIFFYMGTRAENKWVRYYEDKCSELPGVIPTTELETSDGHPLSQPNLVEIESDNKFLIFDRSKDGVTVKDYTGDETAVIRYLQSEGEENYFTLFNRSKDGLRVCDADDYFQAHTHQYYLYKDILSNAIAFQARPDGSVGYKYMVKDCNSENPSCSYKIESEFSNPGFLHTGEWAVVHVRFLASPSSQHMRLMFYVNGKIVLVSRWLPMLAMRELDDNSDKQEGVPFNISLGGGTQGLCDVIYEDFRTLPEKEYPLTSEFGGSFIGCVRSFKFYSCHLNFNQITQNYRFEARYF